MITDFNQLDLTRQYTYANYLTWMFEERVDDLKVGDEDEPCAEHESPKN